MAVAYTLLATIDPSGTGSAVFTQSVTVPAGTTQLVVHYHAPGGRTVSTITFGAASLSVIGASGALNATYKVEAWHLDNPTAGTDTVTLTISGTGSCVAHIIAVSGSLTASAFGTWAQAAASTIGVSSAVGELPMFLITASAGSPNTITDGSSPALTLIDKRLSAATTLLTGDFSGTGAATATGTWTIANGGGTKLVAGYSIKPATSGVTSTGAAALGGLASAGTATSTTSVTMTGTSALGGLKSSAAGASTSVPSTAPAVVALPSSLILPGPTSRRTGLRLPAALVWRARDLTVSAATGQTGTLTRTTAGTGTDSAGRATAVPPGRAVWTMVSGVGRLKAVGGTAVGDLLSWPFTMPALQQGDELTLYVELEPGWARTGTATGAPGILALGGTAAFAADGKLALDLRRDDTVGQIDFRAAAGTTTLDLGSGAIPGSGTLAILAQLRASGASHQLHLEVGNPGVAVYSVDSGSVIALAGYPFRSPVAVLNSRANGDQRGDATYRLAVIARGRRTAAEMTALA